MEAYTAEVNYLDPAARIQPYFAPRSRTAEKSADFQLYWNQITSIRDLAPHLSRNWWVEEVSPTDFQDGTFLDTDTGTRYRVAMMQEEILRATDPKQKALWEKRQADFVYYWRAYAAIVDAILSNPYVVDRLPGSAHPTSTLYLSAREWLRQQLYMVIPAWTYSDY